MGVLLTKYSFSTSDSLMAAGKLDLNTGLPLAPRYSITDGMVDWTTLPFGTRVLGEVHRSCFPIASDLLGGCRTCGNPLDLDQRSDNGHLPLGSKR